MVAFILYMLGAGLTFGLLVAASGDEKEAREMFPGILFMSICWPIFLPLLLGAWIAGFVHELMRKK